MSARERPDRINRARRRQIQKLAERIGRITQADRLYFERFPHQRHRNRIASQVEIEQHAISTGAEMVLPSRRYFVVVRNVVPGARLRLMFVGPRDADTDLGEAQARIVYEIHNNDRFRQIEAELREIARTRK